MKLFAIALYDNEAETEDELNFKKNDLLQVIEYDYMGMEGWWLCKLLKANKIGLAAGNRLKITNDSKLVSNYINLNKNLLIGQKDLIISNSSSSCSIISSSSSLSTSSNEQKIGINKFNFKFENVLSLEEETNNKSKTLNLPEKYCSNQSQLKLFTQSTSKKSEKEIKICAFKNNPSADSNNDDDYDYDIPENNQPIHTSVSNSIETSTCIRSKKIDDKQDDRKSISPTIDSGVSTSSLMSLNSENTNTSTHTSSSSTLKKRYSIDSIEKENSALLESKEMRFVEFQKCLDKILINCCQLNEFELNNQNLVLKKEKIIELKKLMYNFLTLNLKTLKASHACFHPNLNVFNKFKTIYRQLKEFYFFYESSLNSLEKVYAWNYDLILKTKSDGQTNEYFDLVNKINYFSNLINLLKQFVIENKLFDFNSESSLANFNNVVVSESISKLESRISDNDDYQYDYDNNQGEETKTGINIETESDYCVIDDDDYEEISKLNENSYSSQETKLKREIRLKNYENQDSSKQRLNLCDQMLIKFYLKHIEENMNELELIFNTLINKFKIVHEFVHLNDLTHKFALNGHKLVFICDTLQRNINHVNLKQNLLESSNNLSSSLKIYMMRLKSNNLNNCNNETTSNLSNTKQNQIIIDTKDVLECANNFKQIILKSYFKTF